MSDTLEAAHCACVVAHIGDGVLYARRVVHVGDEELKDIGHVQLVIVLAEHLPGSGDVERGGELVNGADATAHEVEENNGMHDSRRILGSFRVSRHPEKV